MNQGFKNVEEYHRDMKVALSREIHLASRRIYPNTPNNWKGKEREREKPGREKSPKKGSILPPLDRKEERKLPNLVLASKSNSIKCFKCLGEGHIPLQYPNKRSMVMKKDGIVDNANSKSKSSSKNSVNVASTRVVEKLKLPTLDHHKAIKAIIIMKCNMYTHGK
ncbi:hypothetical protein CR513_53060, partial [Mucuna pruriens]